MRWLATAVFVAFYLDTERRVGRFSFLGRKVESTISMGIEKGGGEERIEPNWRVQVTCCLFAVIFFEIIRKVVLVSRRQDLPSGNQTQC